MDSATLSAFDAAREKANLVGRRYAIVAVDFRLGRIGVDEYLVARAERDAVELEYDLAEAAVCREQAEIEAHETPAEAPAPSIAQRLRSVVAFAIEERSTHIRNGADAYDDVAAVLYDVYLDCTRLAGRLERVDEQRAQILARARRAAERKTKAAAR